METGRGRRRQRRCRQHKPRDPLEEGQWRPLLPSGLAPRHPQRGGAGKAASLLRRGSLSLRQRPRKPQEISTSGGTSDRPPSFLRSHQQPLHCVPLRTTPPPGPAQGTPPNPLPHTDPAASSNYRGETIRCN